MFAKVMPKNIALADAHPQVRAGLAALDDVSSVITNPEISNIASNGMPWLIHQFTEVT